MTLADVQAAVEEIRDASRDDDETAHMLEDRLRHEVLTYIAANAPKEFAELAAAALTTEAFDFARWCA